MLSRLLGLLGVVDPLIRAARGADRQAFARLFWGYPVGFASLPESFREGVPAGSSYDELLAQIEAAAKDLSERNDFEPFSYVRDGRRRMPLFTGEKRATTFAHAYAGELQRAIPLQVLTVVGASVVRFFGECDEVVLNDRSKDEYVLSANDIALLRRVPEAQQETGLDGQRHG